jgi:hypothetical protein
MASHAPRRGECPAKSAITGQTLAYGQPAVGEVTDEIGLVGMVAMGHHLRAGVGVGVEVA